MHWAVKVVAKAAQGAVVSYSLSKMRSPAVAAFVFALVGAPLVSCSGSTIGGAPDGDDQTGASAGSSGQGSASTDDQGTDDVPSSGQGASSGGGADDGSPATGSSGGSSGQGSSSNGGGDPGTSTGGTTGSGGSSSGDGVSDGSGGGTASVSYLPARIRRMTNAELSGTIRAVFNVDVDLESGFVPDTRQDGFSRNAAQIVDPLFARQLQTTAEEVATQFVPTLAGNYPCVSAAGDEACATTILADVLPAAFRRDVEGAEIDALVQNVFRDAASEDGFEAGMQLAITAALQSASFIYHTELGQGNEPSAASRLTAAETASAMAYLLTGMPPDDELALAAASGALDTSDGRAAQASRLLGLPAARPHLATFVKEWLGIDAVVDVGKDKERFPEYETLRPHMLAETDAFVEEVVFVEGGSLTTLLGADFTLVGQEMASFYGVSSPGGSEPVRVSLADAGRRGILNHASFLARYATEIDSAPIHRGVAVGERVMCMDPGDPTALNVDIVPPQPDPSQTTRERFAQHTLDPECAGCHSGIDGVGFTFENFDAMGKLRAQDNNKPVDTTTSLPSSWASGLDQDQFTDSNDLAAALSRSESVKRCFVRHASRFAGTVINRSAENYFISQWEQLEASNRDSIVEILVAWISSDIFVERAAQGGTQ